MYKLTIFSGRGHVETFHTEYPKVPPLEPGQWIDICRVPTYDSDILDHIYEELELDFCST